MSDSSNERPKEDRPFDITLNIEGRIFQTSETTANSVPGSLLADLNKASKYFNTVSNAYCFDRDSTLFPYILTAHRSKEVHVPRDVCAIQFKKELEFWRILKSLIAPCCWSHYYGTQEDLDTLHKIIKSTSKTRNPVIENIRHAINSKREKSKALTAVSYRREIDESSWRYKLWLLLDEPRSSRAAMIWSIIFVLIAIISVVLNVIWLENWVRVDPYLRPYVKHGNAIYNEKIRRLLMTDPHIVLLGLDCFCTLFFALEVFVHFVVCPNKKRYFYDWFSVIKAILSLCMVYSTVYEIRKDWLSNGNVALIWFLVKSMNTLRALLIFKLIKLSSTLNIVFLSFMDCQKELWLLILMLFLMMIMYDGLIFAFEMDSDMFPNTTTSMWWALITMTTIGYGDFHPTRPMGYLVGMSCAVEGIMMIAVPVAVIASQFSKFKDRFSDLQQHLEAIKQDKPWNENTTDSEGTPETGDELMENSS